MQTNQTCTNSGTLTNTSPFAGGSVGLQDFGSLTVTNTSSGTISGTGPNGYGIVAQSATVANSGIVSGGIVGIETNSGDVTVTNSGTISGGWHAINTNSGNVTVINSGTMSAGANHVAIDANFANTTVTNFGTISAGANAYGIGANFGNATVTNSGTVSVGASGVGISANFGNATVTNAGTISVGTGGLGINANFGNATVTNSGTISVGAGGRGVSVNGVNFSANLGHAIVTNYGTITGGAYGIVADTAMMTNSGTISGAIGIHAAGGSFSMLVNSGTITGTGGAAIEFGAGPNTLTLGPGFVIQGKVLGSGGDIFQLGGSGSGTFDLGTIGATQQYEGFTAFNVTGGTWTVTNNFGQAQTWNVDGGTLAGTGTLSSINVGNGGTLEPGLPGTAGGTLTIKGNLVLASAAAYLITINGAAGSQTSITGTATLGGATVSIAPGSLIVSGQHYTILAAGSLSGTFKPAVSFGPFVGALTYDPTDVFVTFAPTPTLTSLLPPGSSANPINVGNAIDSFIAGGGVLPPGLANIFNFSPQQIGNALTQLSGEAGTGALQGGFQMTSAFLSLLLDPNVDDRGGRFGPALPFAPEREALPPEIASGYAKVLKAPKALKAPVADVPRFSVWGAAFGGGNRTGGDPGGTGIHDTSSRMGGFAAGLDYQLSPDSVVGFALAGGGTSWLLSGGLGGGRSDVFQGGVYGSRHFGVAYLAGALSYGSFWLSTNRTVTVAGADQLSASFLAQDLAGRLEGGYRVPTALAFAITPYGALQAQSFKAPAYTESVTSGSPQFALSYNAKTATAVRAELGSRADQTFRLRDGSGLELFGRLAWAHGWQSDPALNVTFLGLPTASFVVNGASPPRDLLLLTAGAEWRPRKGWSLLAKFDGEFADASTTYAGTARVKYTW